ncbi:MAG: autotransporter-associated beta strand repeat-containing protein [Kiritimatiellae bacterium]|nr:autotransporter-associated beta strand repeat-containing protein [Kiritimatiellia bacterium]
MNTSKTDMIVAALAAVAGLSLSAATYTWIPGSTDWQSKSSYKDEDGVTPVAKLPGGVDTVEFTGTQTVVIGDDDMAFVSSLKWLAPRSNSVTLEFDLARDACLTAGVVNIGNTGYYGKLVKKGNGALQFGDAVMSGDTVSNYKLHEVVVDGGTLISPTNVPAYNHFSGGTMTVNENGTFIIPSPGNFRFAKVLGTGTISNLVERSGVTQFQPTESGSVFGGKLSGTFKYISAAEISLTGTESTINNGFTIYSLNAQRTRGTVGVMKLGASGTPSSVGKNSTINLGSGDGSACLLYLGSGEWTNRKFSLGATKGEPITIDAGAHGGLYFAGDGIAMGSTGMIPLVLDGSNTVNACVVSNSIACKTANGTNYTVQITKKGTGKWRFTNEKNAMAGAIAVENGTLQFDSLAERGTACALGTATELYKPTFGLAKKENKVDHAYLLGSAGARGIMEYVGTKVAACTNRPVRLKEMGGGFSANGGSVQVGDFASADANGSTLVLSGGNSVENFAFNATDGAGPLSMVKEGAGTWVLERRHDFSGTLKVNQGTLIARNNHGQKYSWYRIWFMEKGSTSPKYSGLESGVYVQVAEFALKNAAGVQQNICTNEVTDWTTLKPGECARGVTEGYRANWALWRMFDGINDYSHYAQVGSDYKSCKIDDPNTWFSVVLRLPEDADDVVKFDMSAQQGGTGGNQYAGRNPTAVSIEASVDGALWEVVGGITDIPITTLGGCAWISTAYTSTPEVLALSGSAQACDIDPLENVGPISVASGATLRFEGVETPISELNLIAAGNGTIENAVFASSGTLTVNGVEKGKATPLAVTFRNCSNVGNLTNWTLCLEEGNASRYRIQVGADGSIAIVPLGLVITFR